MMLIFRSAVFVAFAHIVYGQSANNGARECLNNNDCPSDRLCAEFKCINPCLLNFCGDPSNCKVSNHIPVCACRRGFSGPLNGKPSEQSSGKKKYQLFLERMNWYEASMHCSSQGMRLATIESQADQDDLANLIKNSDTGSYKNELSHRRNWWIGGADHHNFYDYVWFSSGKPITYRNFEDGQPDSDIYKNGEWEHCVQVLEGKNYQWNDIACSQHQYFVCEYFE